MKTYSVKQIAELLDTNPETVRRWIRSGKLKAVQVSKKSGNVISENELERFIKTTPKYMSRLSVGVGLATLSPMLGVGMLAGGLVASAILGYREERDKEDFSISSEDFKEYLEDKVVKLSRSIEDKMEIIRKIEDEIEELSNQIYYYDYIAGRDDIIADLLEAVNNNK